MGSTERGPRVPRSCQRDAELDALVFFAQAMKLIDAEHPGIREVEDLRRKAYLTATSEIAKAQLEIDREPDEWRERAACERRRTQGCTGCAIKSLEHTRDTIKARFGPEALRVMREYGRSEKDGPQNGN